MKKVIFYLLLSFLIIPVLYLIMYSILNFEQWPSLLPSKVRLDGYQYFIDFNFEKTLLFSMIISILASSFAILICLPCARITSSLSNRARLIVRVIFILPLVVPITSISIGVYYQFLVFNLAGNSLGIIIIHMFCILPYTYLILERAFTNKVFRKEKIALQLKAKPSQLLTKITIPLIMPAIITSFALGYTISFSQYFTTFLIGSGKIKTYAMELYPYIIADNRHYGAIFNIIFMLSIVFCLGVFITVLRYFYKLKYHYKV